MPIPFYELRIGATMAPALVCTVHKHRNLLAHAPERLHEEITADYTDMIYAATRQEIEAGRKALPVPDGIRLVYQPPYSPQSLQPAEHLWPLVDEPLANTHFDTIDNLDAVVAKRCCHLHQDQQTIASHTNFHWWPKSINPN